MLFLIKYVQAILCASWIAIAACNPSWAMKATNLGKQNQPVVNPFIYLFFAIDGQKRKQKMTQDNEPDINNMCIYTEPM